MVRSAVSNAEAGFINAQVRSHAAEAQQRSFMAMREHMTTAPAAACLHNSTMLHAALTGIWRRVGVSSDSSRRV